ncbi:MAG: glycosyl hydrolase, partial [Isosphaeraceae bacterium]
AFPVRGQQIDHQGKRDLARDVHDGRLQWQPPAGSGRWHVLVVTRDRLFKGTHCETNLSDRLSYPNLLMAEPTQRFLEVTHGRYAKHLGADLGKLFVSTFTDEPSLMSLFMKPMPYRVLPWSPGLPAAFQARRGYPLAPVIPDLILDAGAEGRKHRHDFWLTVAELVSENYFGQIQEWCHEHNLRSGGHLLMEESLTAHVPLYGDFLRCARRLDAPSIDCLTSSPQEVPWYIARLLASAAELEGKTVVMCETSDFGQVYRGKGDKRPVRHVTEAEIRGACNRLMVGGVNCITSYYSFAGLDDESLRGLNNWVGRCATMLTGGHQVADVALVYPVQSVWPRFVPSHEWTREAHDATKIESIYRGVMDSLFHARRDFTIVDARALSEAKVTGGTLTHGKLRWRVVVLPGADTLPLAAWENLAHFVREGGVLISLGSLPSSSDTEFPSPPVQTLASEIFSPSTGRPCSKLNAAGGGGIFLPAGSEDLLPIVLREVVGPDVRVKDERAPLRVTHRRIARHEVYFVINDSPRPWRGLVQFAAGGTCEVWDPASGKSHAERPGQVIVLAFEPYGAALVRFAMPVPPARHRLGSGVLPRLILRPLPRVTPTTPHGEFVTAELHPAAPAVKGETPRFDAIGRLTRSHVDTFMFVRFSYKTPQVLGPLGFLVVDIRVPEARKTAPRLLVILHEEGGGDFLAETGLSVGKPGHERLTIPISRFQLAGWSHDGDGMLDPSRISDVSIGWGGYLGTEGEVLRFQVESPQVGSVSDLKPAL